MGGVCRAIVSFNLQVYHSEIYKTISNNLLWTLEALAYDIIFASLWNIPVFIQRKDLTVSSASPNYHHFICVLILLLSKVKVTWIQSLHYFHSWLDNWSNYQVTNGWVVYTEWIYWQKAGS